MSEDKLSEADLCAEFRVWAEARHWLVHPEVQDWDLVLVPGPTAPKPSPLLERMTAVTPDIQVREPSQLGIQAKLLGNVDVLYQAVSSKTTGPNSRAVLVRRALPEFVAVAHELGLAVISREVKLRAWGKGKDWVQAKSGFIVFGEPRSFNCRRQLVLPPVVTNLVAGGPAPKQLTAWRVKAFKVCKLLRERGWVTTADFRTIGIDWRRWEGQWLQRDGREDRKLVPIRFIAKPGAKLPDEGWDDVIAALEKKDLDDKATA